MAPFIFGEDWTILRCHSGYCSSGFERQGHHIPDRCPECQTVFLIGFTGSYAGPLTEPPEDVDIILASGIRARLIESLLKRSEAVNLWVRVIDQLCAHTTHVRAPERVRPNTWWRGDCAAASG